MNLYQIHTAIRLILNDSPDGELSDKQLEAINGLSLKWEEKAEGYCAVHRELNAEADAIEAEAKRLQARADARRKEADRVKDRLQQSMEALGQPKLKTPRFSAWIQANPPSVKVECAEESLPLPFLRVKTVYVADKKALLEAAEAGKELPAGVSIVRGQHLRIK